MEPADTRSNLARGRDAYRRRSWGEAFQRLAQADRAEPLTADDLWTWADAAYLTGRDERGLELLERAFRAYLEEERPLAASRSAFWLGFRLADRGEIGQASGWFGRAHRLLDHERSDSVERGYLLLPVVQQRLAGGDYEASYAAAEEAATTGARFGDGDLFALALHAQGRARLRQGRVDEGLALLDEVMVGVTADELSPVVTGVVYCSVIAACQEVYALRRAHEWTAALSRWCDRQPDLVPFSGQCRVHRSEVMQLRGAWHDALGEARSARERAERGEPRRVAAAAWYQQAELHRLRGEFDEAEQAYREAGDLGKEPQPGLALLWWARGNLEAAAASIQRVEREATRPTRRARILPAYLEIMLAMGELPAARRALTELEALSAEYGTEVLAAIAAEARGALALDEGDAGSALVALRQAQQTWQALEAPYESARVRWRIGTACRALHDDATADLESEAARAALRRLGAGPDLARLEASLDGAAASDPSRLTTRELEVLRLLASGSTNRAIAAELSISPRTVDRHVSNIFDKLGVSSRAAATAYAYQHELL